MKKRKIGGIYATGHDWRWSPADPKREKGECPCGVKIDAEPSDDYTGNVFYVVDGKRVDELPPCPRAAQNEVEMERRHAAMIEGTRSA